MKITSNTIESESHFLIKYKTCIFFASKMVFGKGIIDFYDSLLFIGSIRILNPIISKMENIIDSGTLVIEIDGITDEKDLDIATLLRKKFTIRQISKALSVSNNRILKIKNLGVE